MIVPMKKVSVVVLDSARRTALEALRELGVLHLQPQETANDTLEALRDKRTRLVRALQLVPPPGKTRSRGKRGAGGKKGKPELENDLLLANRVAEIADRDREIGEEIGRLDREETRLREWGPFLPDDIAALRQAGVSLRLVKMSRGERESLPGDTPVFTIREVKERQWLAVVSPDATLPGEEVALPPMGLRRIAEKREAAERERRELDGELQGYRQLRAAMEMSLAEIDRRLEFEAVGAGMSREGILAYLSGFAPVEAVEAVQRTAGRERWAVLIEEPAEDDAVPTLVRNPKWIRIIQPVIDFLGTVPGYREYDISLWFLLFFSVFFAMIIGDAGYGCIFLLLTVLARVKMRKAPPEIFLLLAVTSLCTVAWGAITGTWFGSAAFVSDGAPLSVLVIDSIASFSSGGPGVMKTTMHICFLIGAVHLSLAHIKNFVKNLPRIGAFAEIGWLSILWGMYFLVRLIVLENGDFGVLSSWFPGPWLLAGGLLFVVLFDEQKGSFFKGVGLGLAKLPLKFLDSISSFSDVISYVRLFAVGLASLEVAKAFNAMALDMGFALPAGLGAAFILFFGHSLNIVMGVLSLIVHGVRLNMLEFSGHLNMEWSGIPYKPFQNHSEE